MSGRFVLAQISDMHIRAHVRDDGFDPAGNLKRAMKAIRAIGVDAIIATGDNVNDERPEEYGALAELVRDPPAPLYLAPGNHDSIPHLRAAFRDHKYLPPSGPISYVIDDYPVRLVMIDQIVEGETSGDFTPAHVTWLEEALAARAPKPTLIALHHPPFSTHDVLLDTINLHHAERLAAVVAKHPEVQLIVCGHHHRPVLGRIAHAPVVVSPSTAWTFGLALKIGQPLAQREHALIGWTLHIWTPETGFASHFMSL